MDSNIDWIYELEDEYKINNTNEINNISDWNHEDPSIYMPDELLEKSSKINSFEYSQYYFIEDIEKSKINLSKYISLEYNIIIDKKEILFVNNSTYAIFLTCKALKELNLKRALLVTPLYFSIEHNLKELNFALIYYHLHSSDNFEINTEYISKLIDEQFIDVIFITNPIFGVGKIIDLNILKKIFEIIISKQIWIVIDNTLGEISWNKKNNLFNIYILQVFTEYDKLIYIDSSTKKLFINGLKHSVIVSNLPSLTSINYDSDYNIGSLTVNQVKLIDMIYDKENKFIINETMNKNIDLFMNNYLMCQNLLIDSEYYLVDTNSSFHTCIMHKSLESQEVDKEKLIRELLFKYDTILFPLDHFLFHKTNKLGFRINLSKHPHKIYKSLQALININL